jgi:hypothetical protein
MTRRQVLAATPFVVLGLAAVVLVALKLTQDRPYPTATVTPLPPLGHAARTTSVKAAAASGHLATLVVNVVQQGVPREVLRESFSGQALTDVERQVTVDAAKLELAEGPATLQVLVEDTAWRPSRDEGPRLVVAFTVDLTPPVVELLSHTRYVRHSGSAVAVYRATGAASSGVRTAGAFFSGHAGLGADPAVHVALFSLPYDQEAEPPALFAEDEAGNVRRLALPVVVLPGTFGTDTVSLTTGFLQRKVPELSPRTPGDASPEQLLEEFLKVNREGRQAHEERIREVTTASTSARPLWSGPFVQQPATQVRAAFPQRRTYLFDGRRVDEQWHLGLDLASRERSPVLASNAGRVAFAGDNGIYGNTVILDHGLGLFSLYAHLSRLDVGVGDEVARGAVVGASGQTGSAGGDHLHFATLLSGVYVLPIEWWDAKWIHDRIAGPLQQAGIAIAGVTDVAPPAPMARGGKGKAKASRPAKRTTSRQRGQG